MSQLPLMKSEIALPSAFLTSVTILLVAQAKTFGTIPGYSFPSFLTSIGRLLTGAKLHSLNPNLAPSVDLHDILVQTTEAPCPNGCSSLLARGPAKEGTALPHSLFTVVYAASLSHPPSSPHIGLFCFWNMPNSSLYLGLYANLPRMFFLLILSCPTSCHCKCQFKCHLFGETFSDVPS